MMLDSLSLGIRLRLLREKRGLTQKKVAEMLGIRPPSLCAYEKDQNEPDMDTLRWYANYFGISTDWMLGLTDEVGWRRLPDGTMVTQDAKKPAEAAATPLSDAEIAGLRALLAQQKAD